MAVIQSVATAQPAHRCDFSSFSHIGREWLGAQTPEFELFERIVRNSKINFRSFAIAPAEILALNGLRHRAELFFPEAVKLGSAATSKAIRGAAISPENVSALIFTSCSVPSIPSPDTAIIDHCGLSRAVMRVPMFQQGCGGGAAGLALAGKLADGMMAPVVLTSAELCSLVYQPADRSAENIVGSAIFADGAASLVMGPGETGHRLLASSSHLIPDSAEMMGYNLLNDGIHLRLARELPECLAKHTPQAISEFLKKVGTSPDKVSWWLFHPGGARILTIFAEKLGLTTQQMRWSWDVLSKYGNMSSASILYVLEAFLGDKSYQRGDKAIIVGMGPGLSLEFTLFECHA